MKRAWLASILSASFFMALTSPAWAQDNLEVDQSQNASIDRTIGELLDDPAARAVLAECLPNFVDNPGIGPLRQLTLRALQQISPQAISATKLEEIEAAFAAAPAASQTNSVSADVANEFEEGVGEGLSAASTIGELLDDPAARAVLDQEMPALVNAEDVDRLRDIPLEMLQQIAPQAISEAKLDHINSELNDVAAQSQ
jgi:hypothetical protein